MTTGLFILLHVIFWGCVILIGHSYVFYPLLMRWLSRDKNLPAERFESEDELPEAIVLMAVYNEDSVLERTLASILESDYPREKLSLWIGSDGSTDRSHEIIERFQILHPELRLEIFGGRNGKIRIINQLSKKALAHCVDPDTALFLLCDANVAWESDALRRMASHFKRPEVGLVGAQVIDPARERKGIGDGEEAYISMENRTKLAEGVIWGNLMGAFGALYSLRARLFRPVPETYIVDDFFQTMACLASGHQAIVDPEAICYESVSIDMEEEFRRKRRIATGDFQNLAHFSTLVSPFRGRFVNWFAFWSHKGIRWIGPLLLLGALLSCSVLAVLSPLYLVPLVVLIGTLVASLIDMAIAELSPEKYWKPFRFVRYFYAMNAAMLVGMLDYLRGEQNSVWEPTKRIESANAVSRKGVPVKS